MDNYTKWRGKTVLDMDGNKIGSLGDLFVDDDSGKPAWATVMTGFFGSKENFFPISLASVKGDDIVVSVAAAQIKDAPKFDAGEILTKQEEQALYQYYQQDWNDDSEDAAAAGQDTNGPSTDNAMTRSEEELQVGTKTEETGRVRLKKYIVTEHVTTTVPIQREEVRLVREPITDANRDAAMDGPELSEEEHEVILHEEVPVIGTKVVAKERVTLDKKVINEEQTVGGDIRKEQIDVDDDSGTL